MVLQSYITNDIHNMFSRFSLDITLIIDEFDGLVNNQIYNAVETYLDAKISPNKHRLKVSKTGDRQNLCPHNGGQRIPNGRFLKCEIYLDPRVSSG